MRKCLSIECRVAVTIWRLATPIEYHTIAHLFGIARSTVCKIVHETCRCIVDALLKEYINFPTSNCISTVVEEFKTKWGVPQCYGAIDGCHIPISVPNLMHTDYYNRKGWYSMLVVNANYRFLDMCVGWPVMRECLLNPPSMTTLNTTTSCLTIKLPYLEFGFHYT